MGLWKSNKVRLLKQGKLLLVSVYLDRIIGLTKHFVSNLSKMQFEMFFFSSKRNDSLCQIIILFLFEFLSKTSIRTWGWKSSKKISTSSLNRNLDVLIKKTWKWFTTAKDKYWQTKQNQFSKREYQDQFRTINKLVDN